MALKKIQIIKKRREDSFIVLIAQLLNLFWINAWADGAAPVQYYQQQPQQQQRPQKYQPQQYQPQQYQPQQYQPQQQYPQYQQPYQPQQQQRTTRKFFFTPGLGISSISYKQDNKQDFKMLCITPKLMARIAINKLWDTSFSAYFTGMSLSKNLTSDVRFYGFNARIGYVIPSIEYP